MEKRKNQNLRQKERKEKATERSGLWWISRMEDEEAFWLYIGRNQWIPWRENYVQKPWRYAESSRITRQKRSKVSDASEYSQLTNINSFLRDELLLNVFRLLPLLDLGVAMVVCRRWRDVGETPGLWDRLRLTVDGDTWLEEWREGKCYKIGFSLGNLHLAPAMLSARRLRGLRKLRMNAISEELLCALQMVESHGVRAVEFGDMILLNDEGCRRAGRAVEPKLFGKTMAKMEEVAMFETCIFADMAKALFTDAISSSSPLRKISIASVDSGCGRGIVDLYKVEPQIWTRVTMKLEVLVIPYANLSAQQMEAVFAGFCGQSQLKKLDISGDMCLVEPWLLGKAVSQLKELRLPYAFRFRENNYSGLSDQQATAIFAAISQNCELKKLDLSRNNLSLVDPDLVGRAVESLEELHVFEASLTNHQVEAIIVAIHEKSKLKKLRMGNECHRTSETQNDFSSVEAELLAKAVNKMEYVDLYGPVLSKEQLEAILTRRAIKTSLKKIWISKTQEPLQSGIEVKNWALYGWMDSLE